MVGMATSKHKTYPGFWNGHEAWYRVMEVTVGREPDAIRESIEKNTHRKRYLWFIPFIGEKRQVIEVNYGGDKFYMDNETGQGLYKVTIGQGSPGCAHASIYPDLSLPIDHVPPEEWIHFNEGRQLQHELEVNKRWKKLDPEGYPKFLEQIEGLKKLIINGHRLRNPLLQ